MGALILRALSLLFATLCAAAAADKTPPLSVTKITRAEPVDFEREIRPFLSDNCLACHCETTHKGKLNLETPELMRTGGENGAGVEPGKGRESLVFQAAAHLDDDLAMPPRENKAKAHDLTPEQLGLLELWIDQGAKPSPKVERVIEWQPLAPSLDAIFAVAVTGDGQFAACSRENRLFIYHLPSGRLVAEESGYHDQIDALAFHPDGTLLATGGYREVKLWRRTGPNKLRDVPDAGAHAVLSPDGKWLASPAADGVHLLTPADGKLARTLAGKSSPGSALAFSPDSARLLCATGKTLILWAASDGACVATAEAPAEIAALAWLPDGKQFAAAGADGAIRTWSDTLAAGAELRGPGAAPVALAACPPNRIVSASSDGTVCIWELGKNQPVAQMNHGAPVTAIAVRGDGKRIASAGGPVARLWSPDGKPVAELRGDRYARETVSAADRGVQVAASDLAHGKEAVQAAEKATQAAADRTKKSTEALAKKQEEFDAKQKAFDEKKKAREDGEHAVADAVAGVKTDDETLAAADREAQAAKAAAESLKQATPPDQPAIDEAAAKAKTLAEAKAARDKREAGRKQLADKIPAFDKAQTEANTALEKAAAARKVAEAEVALSKTGEQKAAAAAAAAKTETDSAETARQTAEQKAKAAATAATAAEQAIHALAFAPDGSTIATAGDDHRIHTWSAENGAAFDAFPAHEAAITTLAFAPDGALLSTAQDGHGAAWNLAPQWKIERTIGSGDGKSPLTDRVNALAFSPDGRLLATGSGEPSRSGEIKVWNVADGALVHDFAKVHSDAVLALDFSPDGRLLASGAADRMARVIELATGKVIRNFEGHSQHVLGISWTPDGRTVATAGADGMVKLWDFPTGDRKKNIEGYDKEVTAVRFVAATGNLVTSSGDNRVRLLDQGGKDLHNFPGPAGFMQAAAVTADGKTVLSGGEDGILHVWDTTDGKETATFKPGGK